MSEDDFDEMVKQNLSAQRGSQQHRQQQPRPPYDKYSGVESGIINTNIKHSTLPNFSSSSAHRLSAADSSRDRHKHIGASATAPEKPKRTAAGVGILKRAEPSAASADNTSDYSESSESTTPGNVSAKLLLALELQRSPPGGAQAQPSPPPRPVPSPRLRHSTPLALKTEPDAEVGEIQGSSVYLHVHVPYITFTYTHMYMYAFVV